MISDTKKNLICLLLAIAVSASGCAGGHTDNDPVNTAGTVDTGSVPSTGLPAGTITDIAVGTEGTTEEASAPDGHGEASPASETADIAAITEPNDMIDDTADSSLAPSPRITIRMVGDILLHTPVEEACLDEDGTYDYAQIFSQTENLISDADIAIVNEEVIIGGAELGVSGYPAFNAPYEIGDALTNAGFDVILHATNHVLDKGARGITNCLDYWAGNHPDIEVLGIHESEEDRGDLCIMDVQGIKLAILNYTYGTNGIPIPQDMPYAVDLLDEDRVISDLEEAEEIADFTIVCPHWGTEYRLDPDSEQAKWAKLFSAHGADLVIGTHPHVIEPVEWIDDDSSADTAKDTLVYYSLGNFVNWTSGTGPGTSGRMVGGMADIELTRSESGEVVISDYGITALVTDLRDGPDGVTVYPLRDYTPDMAAGNAIIRQDSSFSYEYCVDLCDKVWGDLWK